MSLVLPLPQPPRSSHHFPLSRSTTPTATSGSRATPSPTHSRPCTPPPLAPPIASHLTSQLPISAPPTPVTMTHMVGMERCRSSEAVLGRSASPFDLDTDSAASGSGAGSAAGGRGGRGREPKATSLLFNNSVPSSDDIMSVEQERESSKNTHATTGPVENVPVSEEITPAVQDEAITAEQEMTTQQDEEDKMDVDEELEVEGQPPVQEPAPVIWGMPKWGWEEERKEVRKGVRLVGMEELPGLIEQHSMIDTPSHVLFPWLHGICDDGAKGRDMAAFFGHSPPFQPPPYRGLCLLLSPPHTSDNRAQSRPAPLRTDSEQTESMPVKPHEHAPTPILPVDFTSREPRERSETMSTSSESYRSTGTTEGTSPSVADWKDPFSPAPPSAILSSSEEECEADVQMHPCESKRVSTLAHDRGLDKVSHPLACEAPGDESVKPPATTERPMEPEPNPMVDDDGDDSEDDWERNGPKCLLLNALHVRDVFDIPGIGKRQSPSAPQFRAARLPNQINLRNLNIQQIKYATISDVVLYTKYGVGDGVLQIAEMIAQAQDALYQHRMEDYYRHVAEGEGEGVNKPVRYGVWVVVEPFHKVQAHCPELVNIDLHGRPTANSPLTDLFEREATESRAMTRGSEVVEGFWVGNDCDVPGGADDGAGATVPFDLCLQASECSEMPTTTQLSAAYRKLVDLDKRRQAARQESAISPHSWTASPATIALRNLLSPTSSPSTLPDVPAKRVASPTNDHDDSRLRNRRSRIEPDYVTLECCGSSRTLTGQVRSPVTLTDRIVELVYFLRKIVEGRDKSGVKRKVLVHCQDGYTESTIIVLCYIMSSLSISLPEAYLHLQLVANRSFFLYPSDKPLLRKVEMRLAADRRAKALKLVTNSTPSSATPSNSIPASPTTPTPSPTSSRWKSWGLSLGKGDHSNGNSDRNKENDVQPDASSGLGSRAGAEKKATVQVAKEMLAAEEKGGREEAKRAKVWFEDKRFDGFPSRILPFLYLGNLDHAGNAAMLQALGITHVVSVGESLITCPEDHDPMHGKIGPNVLCNAYRSGLIDVLDLNDVRDDGNDPLRPLIARACEWIEHARSRGGRVLVHCRVGVSRSASIVMAYMMQYLRMGLMDAYLVTRARRLNVLIQPNLRFFHELFGWEIELARREQAELDRRLAEAKAAGMEEAANFLQTDAKEEKRRVLYSWPAFCRDLNYQLPFPLLKIALTLSQPALLV